MSTGQIAAVIVGALLLLPGLCGTFVFGANMSEHIGRWSFRYTDYEELVWMVSHPSAMAGCLGVFAIAKATGKPGWLKAARVVAWIGLAITIISIVFVINAGRLRSSTAMTEGMMFSVWFLFAFAIGCLPGLLMKQPEPAKENEGDVEQ